MRFPDPQSCPHLNEGFCGIASAIAADDVKAIEANCSACVQQDDPCDVNGPTIGLAKGHLRAAGKPYAHLSSEGLTKGPGSHLTELIPKFFSRKHGCGCRGFALKMDRWGVEGCRQNFDDIVHHLVTQARKHGMAQFMGPITRAVASHWAQLAIDRAANEKPVVATPDDGYTPQQWPFVWTYWAGGAAGDELWYSIQLVRRWHPDARVVVVGDRPEWYDGELIERPRISKRPHHAFKDCYSKILRAAQRFDQFIWMMDDVYWIKPFSIREAATPKYVRHVSQQKFHKWKPRNKWGRTRQAAYQWLLDNNYPTYDFAAHLPQPIDSETFLQNERELGLAMRYKNWECIYFNRFHAKNAEDWGRRYTRITKPPSHVDTRHSVLNHTQASFNETLQEYLQFHLAGPLST